MVSGRGKAATRLNSWSRSLGKEDGIPSPASLSSSTAAACTRSWSRTAARWKSFHRRTGEITVRIFIVTRLVNRNWVRNPILVHLHPLGFTCALCSCWSLTYLSHCQLPCFGHHTLKMWNTWSPWGEKEKKYPSEKQTVIPEIFYDWDLSLKSLAEEREGYVARNGVGRGDTFPLSFPCLVLLPLVGYREIFSLSLISSWTCVLPSNTLHLH